MNDPHHEDGGAIPGSGGQPAFHLRAQRAGPPLPVVIAVPHAGRGYPDRLLQNMRYPGESSLRLEDRFVDLVGEAVARETGASLVVALAPRAMLDLNRAPEDVDWAMVAEGAPPDNAAHAAGRRARSGLGLVPRRLPGMGELWRSRISRAELDERIDTIHRPYHAAVAKALETTRDRWGAALLIDLHSMPPLGPKTGADAAPDFVVGDRYGASCASDLSSAALHHLERRLRRAAHNRPYAGGYVLDRHGAPSRGLHAMQIEVCRLTYLDRAMKEPGQGMDGVIDILSGLVRVLGAKLASDTTRFLTQAAE